MVCFFAVAFFGSKQKGQKGLLLVGGKKKETRMDGAFTVTATSLAETKSFICRCANTLVSLLFFRYFKAVTTDSHSSVPLFLF